MNEIRKLFRSIWDIVHYKEIDISFSGIVGRSDKNLEMEIKETNSTIKKYCKGKGFIFTDNCDINETCLNHGTLHLHKKGTSVLTNHLKSYFTEVEALLDTRGKFITLTLTL